MNDQIPLLDLGKKIRFFKELKGISQEALATQLGISQQAFQKIESGSTKLDIERAHLNAHELEIELEVLLNFNPDTYLYNCTLSATGNGTVNINTTVPKELIESYQKQIESLHDEIKFLRSMLAKKED